jgi:ankyrin repeat protein
MQEKEMELLQACFAGDIALTTELLKDPNINLNETVYGSTIFHLIVVIRNIEIIKILMQDGRADIDKGDKYGLTPFMEVISNGDIEIIKLLMEDKRVSVNIEDNYGLTPLMMACKKGDDEIIKMLRENKRVDSKEKEKVDLTSFDKSDIIDDQLAGDQGDIIQLVGLPKDADYPSEIE